jgi:serine/threonine-protein kinase
VPGAVLEATYELRRVLGAGGMGQVLEAWDRHLRRRVAIKTPWTTVDPRSLLAEAQALASIRHPGVPAVHAIGVHGGYPFVVMERIFGTSLFAYQQHRRGQQLELEEVLHLVRGLAEILVAVHAAGVAHRDIKPDNVMIAPAQRIVLIDLGLMLPEVDVLREGDHSGGTPQYMAPETIAGDVARGEAHLVDVYGLGVLTYELLAGRPPFQDRSTVRVLRAHLATEPPDVRDTRPDTPPRLASLVRSMLAKRPADRPASMEEVLAELGGLAIPRRSDEHDAPRGHVVGST